MACQVYSAKYAGTMLELHWLMWWRKFSLAAPWPLLSGHHLWSLGQNLRSQTAYYVPQDKRRISLLNSDFKVASGLEAGKLKKILTHILSPQQLVAGDDRRIYHGINLARDAIWAAGRRGQSCGILDTDLVAGFDYMTLSWCMKVLEKKGTCTELIARLENLYSNNLSVIHSC